MASPSPSAASSRRRWGAVLALAAVAGLVAWLLASREPPPEPSASSPRPPAAPPQPEPQPVPATPAELVASVAAPAAPAEPAPPVVDEILLEKTEVCSGEENLVTVRAHTVDGNDTHLHYKVGNGTGQRVPVRVWMDERGEYELPQVTVFTRNNVSTTVPLPSYRVKPCQPERLVHVLSRRLPNAEDDFEFLAQVVELPPLPGQGAPKPFTPVRYVWTFDEEPPETTSTPRVSHTLVGGTRASSQYVQHLVRVEVFDAQGRKATGRSSLQLLDTSFENLDKKGVVTVLAVGTPRFPVLGEDGVVRQKFRLYHRARGPVRVEKVYVARSLIPGGDGPAPPEQVDEVPPLVGAVPEGRGVEVEVALDTRAEPEVFSLTYSLEGTSADGHPARGTFSVMRPPPRPTRENSQQVRDPVLLAKIKRARELLRQEFVTDEDLWRLEREGKFTDLPVAATAPGAPPPEPPPGVVPGVPRLRNH
jgi:hypothetical protein